MFFILLAIWLIFSGSIGISSLMLGAAVSALISLFCAKFMDYDPKRFYKGLKKLPAFIAYIIVLIREIFFANITVLGFVWGRKRPESVLVHFKGGMKGAKARVLAANSITLTPGTYTVRLEGDDFYVHALDRSIAEGIETGSLVKKAAALED